MRVRIDLAYDGTDFRGWARQPGLRTVQGVVEDALARILGGSVRLVVAGRTDAGVHASAQVAHLDLTEAQVSRLRANRSGTVGALAARVNGVLGAYPDVVVPLRRGGAGRVRCAVLGGVAPVSVSHCRSGRCLRSARSCAHHAHQACSRREGDGRGRIRTHRSARLCRILQAAPEATTIRTLLEFAWRRDEAGVLVADLKADAFCHSMVRALVGACVAVGEGRVSAADVIRIRDERERVSDIKVLAARGLTLMEIGYPDDDLLASRAEATRARRTLAED